MLGKLFKHEMKAMTRLLLPLCLVLAAMTIIDRIVIYLDIFKGTLVIIPGFITFAYVCSIIAVIAVSAILIIQRFYKNLMTDEGYLMFTLPVKSHQLITSKLLASVVWSVISTVAVIASILVVVTGSFTLGEILDGIRTVMAQIKSELNTNIALFIVETILMIIIGIVNSILMIYTAIAIGQLFNGHKVIGSFAAYIGINFVLQVVSMFGAGIMALIFRNSINDITSITHLMFPTILFFTMILNVIYYLATDFIFKKKLNLE